MKTLDIIKELLPCGTDGRNFEEKDGRWAPSDINYALCPVWPPDIFAVAGTIIERSGCYTEAGPTSANVACHGDYLEEVKRIVDAWIADPNSLFEVPPDVQTLWSFVMVQNSTRDLSEICSDQSLLKSLLKLFALADEACRGMGWDSNLGTNVFADMALATLVNDAAVQNTVPLLPYLPFSLCALVSPKAAVVMPKTLTATVGCTIRSLSHHLALLPGIHQCRASWALTNEAEDSTYKPIRLLVIPFPFRLPASSFRTSQEPIHLSGGTFSAAFFELQQDWLVHDGKALSAQQIFKCLVEPLVVKANKISSTPVTGVIFPECALSDSIATELASKVARLGVSFLTTGILRKDEVANKTRNVAKTFVLGRGPSSLHLEQFKHHRWRLDRSQCEQYGLDFHFSSKADKWWEDIDVSSRNLPFFALRRHMSMTVLICEDLARSDPAMSVVRAVGPNLVIALLMDGPQLNQRWPGKYATVLGEDPGSGVLSVTCIAMLDRSNSNWSGPTKRTVALWRSEGSAGSEIDLPRDHHGVVLEINSRLVEQHTLDARPDAFGTRKLSLRRAESLKLDSVPKWL